MKKIKDKILDFIYRNIELIVIVITILILLGLDYLVATSDLPEWIKFRWFSK